LGDYSIYVNNINTGKILKVNTVTIDDTKATTEIPKTGDNLIFLAMGLLFFGVAIIVEIRSKMNEEKETK
jgi:hypothetical protein